ncbi:MAG: universal stress protein [Bacteroidia bacterium]
MKSILCAYDFSEASESALSVASRLAVYFNANLVVTHVYSVPVVSTEIGYINIDDYAINESTHRTLKERCEKLKIDWPDLHDVEIVVDAGFVVQKLNELAGEKNCDLVVMGIDNEKSFVKEHLLGSSSILEARNTKMPVLIVPKNADNKKITSILYACDYAQDFIESTSLIQVKYFTKMFNARLNILHVLKSDHELNMKERNNDKYIESQLKSTEHNTFFIYDESAAEGIINFVKNHPTDLIIVEPHHRNFFERLFSKSTTKELAFHLNIPILAIHG